MIKLEINSRKELSISKSIKVFKGENMINSIQITALNPYIGDKRVEDCEFNLHVVLPDKSYLIYPVAWSENSVPLTGYVPITSDITSAAQILELYVEITSGNTVIGKSNAVKIQVYNSPDERISVTPREQLEEQISELKSELESAYALTETLENLKGNYNSFPERLADDEVHIATNTENITASQSAIVSLTSALANKLSNSPSSVGSENIADAAVTYEKLSTDLQGKVDAIPENPLFVFQRGHLASMTSFDKGDYCTQGGVYQFTAQQPLAGTIGFPHGAIECELRYIHGYQVITRLDTQQIYSRKVTKVAPKFEAESWHEVISPTLQSLADRVTALETANNNS